jgi:hypothetical protein
MVLLVVKLPDQRSGLLLKTISFSLMGEDKGGGDCPFLNPPLTPPVKGGESDWMPFILD